MAIERLASGARRIYSRNVGHTIRCFATDDDDNDDGVDGDVAGPEPASVSWERAFYFWAAAADSYISAQKANIYTDSRPVATAAAAAALSSSGHRDADACSHMRAYQKNISAPKRRAIANAGRGGGGLEGNKIDCLHVRGIIK